MTFSKYLNFLDKSACSVNEKMRAVQLYSKHEGRMRQDLIKCIIHDEKRKLPQIDENSVEESQRPRKKKKSFKSIDRALFELDNDFDEFLGEVFVRKRGMIRMRSMDDHAMRRFVPLEILEDEEEEEVDN